MHVIKIENVSYTYNAGTAQQVKAVDQLSLTVEEGEFLALCGHNGSGKSTVARLLNGLRLPDEGEVEVLGNKTSDAKNLFEIRKNLGVVFQNPDNQMIATIIEDDVAFGPENIGLEPKLIRERVDWALEAVGMAEHKKGTPFRLSGGQKQRVAIAGVLALKPRIMVLDESTAMLDPVGRAEVMQVVKKLNREEKMTVIMITHFMEEALLADRIAVLDKGKLTLLGGKEIFLQSDKLRSAGLDLPICSEIAQTLRNKGMDIDEGITDIDGLVQALCR